MNLIQKHKSLLLEIFRFGLVGFVSFLCDWAVLMLTLHLFFGGAATDFSVAAATAAGFTVGVTVNYILSVLFVFKNARPGAGRGVRAAVLFLVGAVIGLLLTQAIMNLGVIRLGYNETPVKVAATGIVMIWNYLFRKILIFRNKRD